MLRGEFVLVQEASKTVAAANADQVFPIDWRRQSAHGGRVLTERAVRSVLVVMRGVDAEHALEVLSSEDQHPVEALPSERSHPALGVRVGARRRLRSIPSLRSKLFG